MTNLSTASSYILISLNIHTHVHMCIQVPKEKRKHAHHHYIVKCHKIIRRAKGRARNKGNTHKQQAHVHTHIKCISQSMGLGVPVSKKQRKNSGWGLRKDGICETTVWLWESILTSLGIIAWKINRIMLTPKDFWRTGWCCACASILKLYSTMCVKTVSILYFKNGHFSEQVYE